MEQKELLESISFFKSLRVDIQDVTSEDEKTDHYRAVIARYIYKGNVFETKRLFYREIESQNDIYQADDVKSYFGGDVYWLDNQIHQWPHGTGAEIEETVIEDMYEGKNVEFNILLKTIANNQKTGYLQKITAEGRSQQYGFNLTNNNHWHDLIIFIQEVIRMHGNEPAKSFYSPLVFRWKSDQEGRLSLSPNFGDRKIVKKLLRNVKSIDPIIKMNDLIELLKIKKQIILQGPPGTGKTYTAKDIAEQMIFGEVSDDKKAQKMRLEKSEQFELVQFHPSYSYEDFVRGITAKSNAKGITYETENKVLVRFADISNENLIKSTASQDEPLKKQWLDRQFEQFVAHVKESIDSIGEYYVTDTSSITNIEENTIILTVANVITRDGQFFHSFSIDQIKKFYINNVFTANDLHKIGEQVNSLKYSNEFDVLEAFRRNLSSEYQPALKSYILLIDEINRANLPSVLGELIYALEYRGESVGSMYSIAGDQSITIPENLYIIGTMNTADRSVGHIDYAIKRRFAFVDVEPDIDVIKDEKGKELFKLVEALFVKEVDNKKCPSDFLAGDFDYKDVQLGHSYFIANGNEELKMKLKYEIIPILNEYVKDGVLLETAKNEFEKIAEFEC